MRKIALSSLILFFLSVIAFAEAQSSSYPGDVFRIMLPDQPGIKSITADFLGQEVVFFKAGDKWRGLFSSMPEDQIGTYPVKIQITKTDGVVEKVNRQIKLTLKKFPTVYFTLKPEKKKLLGSKVVADEWAGIEKILTVKNPLQYWEGKFVMPVLGITTMNFGAREFVNKKRRGYHRGVDFRAAVGTDVKAVNSGTIVFAKQLAAFGGTMVIDHGQGVYSLYFHLSKFLVPVGAAISKGRFVAQTGSSGIGSGPHLHWGLSINNVRVNPIQWTKQVF